MTSHASGYRCPTCHLPVSISKRRRELLVLVADGRWWDVPDADDGRLVSLAQDGLIFWVDCRPPDFSGGFYRITERGLELLEFEVVGSGALNDARG